jgi:hypothetical protein
MRQFLYRNRIGTRLVINNTQARKKHVLNYCFLCSIYWTAWRLGLLHPVGFSSAFEQINKQGDCMEGTDMETGITANGRFQLAELLHKTRNRDRLDEYVDMIEDQLKEGVPMNSIVITLPPEFGYFADLPTYFAVPLSWLAKALD